MRVPAGHGMHLERRAVPARRWHGVSGLRSLTRPADAAGARDVAADVGFEPLGIASRCVTDAAEPALLPPLEHFPLLTDDRAQ